MKFSFSHENPRWKTVIDFRDIDFLFNERPLGNCKIAFFNNSFKVIRNIFAIAASFNFNFSSFRKFSGLDDFQLLQKCKNPVMLFFQIEESDIETKED